MPDSVKKKIGDITLEKVIQWLIISFLGFVSVNAHEMKNKPIENEKRQERHELIDSIDRVRQSEKDARQDLSILELKKSVKDLKDQQKVDTDKIIQEIRSR